MSDRLAFSLAALAAVALALDILAFDGAGSLFLARKLAELVHWLAFWR